MREEGRVKEIGRGKRGILVLLGAWPTSPSLCHGCLIFSAGSPLSAQLAGAPSAVPTHVCVYVTAI